MMKLAINGSWMISVACAATLILATGAGASDGVIEINQTCATTTGCVANDSGGFPVFIGGFGAPRSYILTSDLVPTNSGSVLFIDGDDVSLNMNGFSILCSPSSTFGIRYGAPQKNLHVSNGTIVGCQSFGIGPSGFQAPRGIGARIEALTVDSCTLGGISVGHDSIVENSTVIDSGLGGSNLSDSGIALGPNSIARNNIVSGASIGIDCFFAGFGCLVSGNVVRGNVFGFWVQKSTVINNASTGNNTGIAAFDGSSVIGNTVQSNVIGLSLSSGTQAYNTSYRGNSIVGSTTAAIAASSMPALQPINLGQNTCLGPGALSACP